jgi:dolichyl-phosphate beta-glucosyltransferase
MSTYISFVIPAYNEELRISETLHKVLNYFRKQEYSFEIIVVDDGSDDNTHNVVNEFSEVKFIKLPRNQGKGAAVRKGILESKGKFRIFSDADLSTPVHETAKILSYLESGFDVCVGSRALDSDMIKVHQPFYREFMGKTFNKIVQMLVVKGISDTQCGFKGFSAEAADKIFTKQKINGFGFDVEIIFLAKLAELKIIETPVEWYNDNRSKVHPVKDSLKMLAEILKIRNLHK